MKHIPYSPAELEYIDEMYKDSESTPKEIAQALNDVFHNGQPVRKQKKVKEIIEGMYQDKEV